MNGDVGFRFKWIFARGEMSWKHQEPDIVEKGGKLQVMQLVWG